jgi:hypothetical protein
MSWIGVEWVGIFQSGFQLTFIVYSICVRNNCFHYISVWLIYLKCKYQYKAVILSFLMSCLHRGWVCGVYSKVAFSSPALFDPIVVQNNCFQHISVLFIYRNCKYWCKVVIHPFPMSWVRVEWEVYTLKPLSAHLHCLVQ